MNSVFETIDLGSLNNPEHLRLNNRTLGVLIAANLPELSAHLPFYQNAIAAEDASIIKLESNSKTAILENLDGERDSVFSGAGSIIIGNTHHWDPQIAAAAKRLRVIHRTYIDTPRHNYQRESEEIINYLQEMGDLSSNPSTVSTGGMGGGTTGGTGAGMGSGTTGGTGTTGTYSADVMLLNLGPWMDKLKELNNQFISVYNSRSQDHISSDLRKEAQETRRKTDHNFRGCLGIIDLLVFNNGIAAYEELVTAINNIIHEWNVTLNVRRGRKQAQQEQDNTDTPTPPDNNEENGGTENGENNNNTENSDPDNGGFGDKNTPSANA